MFSHPRCVTVGAHRFNQALFRKLGDMGLLGITVPEEYGGAGADVTAACIVHEELVTHPSAQTPAQHCFDA